MNAQVIPFPINTARSAARLFAFDAPPSVEALLERAELVQNLYETAKHAHESGAGWLTAPGRLDALRNTVEHFWERCLETLDAAETVFAALERSGAEEWRKNRVRAHFSVLCHQL